jgi:hypothetical protein
MNTKLALSALIAALMLTACAKQETASTAPATTEATPASGAAADSAAASANSATNAADAATTAAGQAQDAAAAAGNAAAAAPPPDATTSPAPADSRRRLTRSKSEAILLRPARLERRPGQAHQALSGPFVLYGCAVTVSVRDARASASDRLWIENVYRDYLDDLAPLNTGIFPILAKSGIANRTRSRAGLPIRDPTRSSSSNPQRR